MHYAMFSIAVLHLESSRKSVVEVFLKSTEKLRGTLFQVPTTLEIGYTA